MIAFLIWCAVGLFFVVLGLFTIVSPKQAGFWANAEPIEVEDIRGYNRAVGGLFIAFGVVFSLTGIPLLAGQNSPWVLLSVLGVMAETISLMVMYTLVIERRFKKK